MQLIARQSRPRRRDLEDSRAGWLPGDVRAVCAMNDAGAVSPPDDPRLMQRVAQGDDRALGELYDRYAGTVYSLAMAILRDADEAEEATADAFVQIWTNAASWDASRGSVGAWITTIARTRALDRLRSRKRRERAVERATEGDEEGTAVPMSNPGVAPDRAAERVELSGHVARHLAELPDPQRQAIELAFFGGLSHSEIAEELAEPLGTVKTRIRAGMEKLRASMAADRAMA
jgi:RNA polymerase sigma-70 factor (ECF subfamily)